MQEQNICIQTPSIQERTCSQTQISPRKSSMRHPKYLPQMSLLTWLWRGERTENKKTLRFTSNKIKGGHIFSGLTELMSCKARQEVPYRERLPAVNLLIPSHIK